MAERPVVTDSPTRTGLNRGTRLFSDMKNGGVWWLGWQQLRFAPATEVGRALFLPRLPQCGLHS